MPIPLDQFAAVVQSHLAAKKTAGHPIGVMQSFGKDVVPRGMEGKFPYLIIPSPSFNRVLTSCEALYYTGSITHAIYDRNDDNLQLYLGYVEDAMSDIYDNPVEFSSRLPDGFSVDEINPGSTEMRRMGDGMVSAKWSVTIRPRVLRTD